MSGQLSLVKGWRAKAPTKADQLRALLSDGRWHGQHALQKVAGMRFGARLFDLHNEINMITGETPLHYAKRVDSSDDSRVWYRQTDKVGCCICQQERRMRPAVRIAQLEKENAELKARIARLEAGR